MTFPAVRFRYVIAALLFLSTMINYADRSMLAVVSVDLRRDLHLDESDYGQVISLFMIAYAIMYAGSGVVADALGTRRAFALFVTLWSAAAIGHAAAVGKWSLGFWRFLLGLGEPGNWPCSAKAIGEWFPPEKRALGVGIFNAGSSVGSAIAPPMVTILTLRYGWRFAFFFTGALGVLWLVAWLSLYQEPGDSRFLSKEEREDFRVRNNAERAAAPPKSSFGALLRRPETITLMVARFSTDPVIYFVIFWMPEYLRRERAFDLASVGKYAWVPFLFGDIGYLFGGWLSGHLIDRGWALPKARRAVLILAGVLMPAAAFAPWVSQAWMAIGIVCVVTFAHALWISNLLTIPIDLFTKADVGRVSGLSGMGGAIGGALANFYTGSVVAKFSYWPVFAAAACAHPLACAIVVIALRAWFGTDPRRAPSLR